MLSNRSRTFSVCYEYPSHYCCRLMRTALTLLWRLSVIQIFMATKGCIPVKNAMSYIAVNTILSVLIKNVKKVMFFHPCHSSNHCNFGTRWKWVMNFRLSPIPAELEAGLRVSGPVRAFWKTPKSLVQNGFWTPNRPVCSLVTSTHPVVFFYVVTTVHKLDFRLVTNWTPSEWWPT
jgi:hypothetical protein